MNYLLNKLRDEDMYAVDDPSSYTVGPLGGQMYLAWDFTPKPIPSEAELKKALEILVERWPEIVGIELASVTKPLYFSGKKKRRLMVSASSQAVPPWGSWLKLSYGDQRCSFTRFRSAINEAIKPMHVDGRGARPHSKIE